MKSRREQLAEARRLGLTVETVRRTGEVRIKPPNGGPSVRIDNRRKDGTRAVMRMLEAHTPDEARPPKETPRMTTSTTPAKAPKLNAVQAAKVVSGRTTEAVLREIVAEGKADPRITALVARYDAKAARRTTTEGATE